MVDITKQSSRGFTLIEMMVVIAIMAIVSTVVLANNGRFGGKAVLQNIAFEMALSIRQAQAYGIAVRANPDLGCRDGAPPSAYGVGFNSASGNSSTFFMFAECGVPNGSWETGEFRTVYSIHPGYRIHKLCADDVCTDISDLYISFRRPDPGARIFTGTDSNPKNGGCVELESPRNDIKAVVVSVNGQISVENKCEDETEE